MKERPILFSAPMVRALLAGTKTQTRRAIKPQPPSIEAVKAKAGIGYGWIAATQRIAHWRVSGPVWAVRDLMGQEPQLRCRYGLPGDRLWVREAWAVHAILDGRPPRDIDAPVTYAADGPMPPLIGKLRPSMFMTRWASRITLEVTEVRVERLQDISEADAIAEGIVAQHGGGWGLPAGEHFHFSDPPISYWSLWEAINGPGSVEANPWVWAVSFRKVVP